MPNKLRHGKLKPGNQKNRWKKGESASSNPTYNKHRQEALKQKKAGLMQQGTNKMLTRDVMAVHNELTSGIKRMEVSSQEDPSNVEKAGKMSVGTAETSATFLSGLSDCTNMNFTKVLRYWENNQHKEVCAVFAAITEVIRERGGTESETDYFGALVTALETSDAASKSAILFLLSMCVRKLPAAVVNEKFGYVGALLCDILQKAATDGDLPAAMVKSTLVTLSVLMRQVNRSKWSEASTCHYFKILLNFACHPKPKVRKAAQDGVPMILKDDHTHPASTVCGQFCCEQLDGAKQHASSSVCHVMQLMGRVMHAFPSNKLQKACEAILNHVTASPPDPIVRSVGLQTLFKMFVKEPTVDSLPLMLNHQILNCLRKCQPNTSDLVVSVDWLNVMQQGVSHLLNNCSDEKVDSQSLAGFLVQAPKLCEDAFKFLVSNNQAVSDAANKAIVVVLTELEFLPKMEEKHPDIEKIFVKLAALLTEGLNFRYHEVWDRVLLYYRDGFVSFFTVDRFGLVEKALLNIANLRNNSYILNMPERRNALDLALGAAIKRYGPARFLQAVPLLINGSESDDCDFPRSWIIPLLQQNVMKTELAHFFTYVKPLADSCARFVANMPETAQLLSANYKTLIDQCWELLPSYCLYPTDMTSAFSIANAKVLGMVLDRRGPEHAVVRMAVMKAFRNLANTAVGADDRAKLHKFGPNFLPRLFNVYLDCGDADVKEGTTKQQMLKKNPEQLAALETIRHYLKAMPADKVKVYFTSASTLRQQATDYVRKMAMFDLMIATVTYADQACIEEACAEMCQLIVSDKHSEQKKAYRLIEEVCTSTNQPCKAYLEANLDRLRAAYSVAFERCAASSKASRLRCIDRMVASLGARSPVECRELVGEVLPECISCLKDSDKCRRAAFALLLTAAKWYAEGDHLEQLFVIVMEALEMDSSEMKTCAVLALSRLVYEYKEQMSGELLQSAIVKVCDLLATDARDVCKAALGFVMVLFSLGDAALIKYNAELILQKMGEWRPAQTRHFRTRVGGILKRLVRKFDFDYVDARVSDDFKKQLRHIRKMSDREKRKKAKKGGAHDSDDDDQDYVKDRKETMDEILADSDSDYDDDQTKTGKDRKVLKARRRKAMAASVRLEDNEEDPINLLDPSASSKIVTVSKNSKKKKVQNDFKTAKDGRLIIDFGSDDDSDDDGGDQAMKDIGVDTTAGGLLVKKRKRKQDAGDGEEEEDDDGMKSVTTTVKSTTSTAIRKEYRPGGSGIHRDTSINDGSNFRGKRAHGDMKGKSTHDPYAYIPLNAGVLNKRKQKKITGQFNGLVKATSKGANKGKKQQGHGGKRKKLS